MNYVVTDVDVEIEFDGESMTSYPMATGTCKYRGDVYYFNIVESNCLTGFPVLPKDAEFVCWLEDGEGPTLNETPVWANNDEDFPYYYEIEEALELNKEVNKIKNELQYLAYLNCNKKT